MTIVFYDTKVAVPPGFPTNICQFTEEVKVTTKGNVVTWLLYPKSFSTKEGKEAFVAVNISGTLAGVLVKDNDSFLVEKKVKCFGRTFQWLMMVLGEHVELETA